MLKGGFADFVHFRVSDLGWEKGKTPASNERIAEVANRLRIILRDAPQA
jgi:hypothetical protein